jgi:hypothetical protein
MSGKRKPSPESSLISLSPNSLQLSSSSACQFYSDDVKNINNNNGAVSFMKSNQHKIKELTKSAKILQIPQKQNVLLSTRSRTFDSVPPTLELNNSSFAPSSPSLDYDNVQSPGGASNASSEGPTYVRTPGFEHHAQEFEIQRKRQQYSKSHAASTTHVGEELDCNTAAIACGHDNVRSSTKVSQNGAVSTVTTKKKKSLVVETSKSKHEAGTTKKSDSPQQPTTKHKSKKGM